VVLATVATLVAAYFLGSLPTGYLFGRWRGIDLRSVGSGNIGATNALRILGKPAGITVLVIDALKGWLAATLLPAAAWQWLASGAHGTAIPVWLPLVGGLAAVLGHNFTCWLRFKGGKGIATSAGVVLGVLPYAFIAVLVVFAICIALTRIVSLSSLIAAIALLPAAWYWHRHPLLIGFSVVLALLAFLRHRANIQRLLAGKEPRIGQRPPAPPPSHAAPS
jgi:glycerol-3-phosphate acyltransferase PlsY